MKKHYLAFIAAFVLLDIILPKEAGSGCSCSRDEMFDENVIEQTVTEMSDELPAEMNLNTDNNR